MEQQPPSYTPKIVRITRSKYFSRVIGYWGLLKNFDLIYTTQTEEENRAAVL